MLVSILYVYIYIYRERDIQYNIILYYSIAYNEGAPK